MKNKEEIKKRIEDIENAKRDVNDRGNLSEKLFNEFNFKIETLRWVLKGKD